MMVINRYVYSKLKSVYIAMMLLVFNVRRPFNQVRRQLFFDTHGKAGLFLD